MGDLNILTQIAYELGLDFTEETIQAMLNLLENDVSPENLVKILDECEKELKSKSE